MNWSLINVQKGSYFHGEFQEGFSVTFKLDIQGSLGLFYEKRKSYSRKKKHHEREHNNERKPNVFGKQQKIWLECQEFLNNNNLMRSTLALWIFSMTAFDILLNLESHLLEPTFINFPIPGHLLLTCLHPEALFLTLTHPVQWLSLWSKHHHKVRVLF